MFPSLFALTAAMSLQHASGITKILRILEHEMQIQGEPRDLLIGSVVKQVQLSHLRHRVDLLPQLLHSPFGILEVLLDYPSCRIFSCTLFDFTGGDLKFISYL